MLLTHEILGGGVQYQSVSVLLIKPIFYPQIEELFLIFSVLVRKNL